MSTAEFFSAQTPQSQLKAEIVEAYFVAWATIIRSAKAKAKTDPRIGYIDLFSGPGRYEDGALSTPIRILSRVIEDADLSQRVVTRFNDGDKNHVKALEAAISDIEGIENLKYPPQIVHRKVNDDLVRELQAVSTIPLLVFIDPWGYKGLSRALLNAVLKSWGCDCLFYFNYNRINPALSNDSVRSHMDVLFGADRVDNLRAQFPDLKPQDRERLVLRALVDALKGDGHEYVQPFTFKKDNGRTSHHLIMVCDHFKGFEVMRDIAAKRSTGQLDGVPDYTFDPRLPVSEPQQLSLLESSPLERLQNELEETFSGRSLRMRAIFEEHSPNRPFIARNYKHALLAMEKAGRIEVIRAPRGHKTTVANEALVCFPT